MSDKPTAEKIDDVWICLSCKLDVFAGCDCNHGEWVCLDCDEWTYPFYYDIEDGCQYCGSDDVEIP